jgi:hypothetical protein
MSAFLGIWLSENQTSHLNITVTITDFSKIMRREIFHLNYNETAVPRGQPGHDPAHKDIKKSLISCQNIVNSRAVHLMFK